MSRHRNIRNMDISEDYNDYDDVFGHSVEDDHYISPSHRQFIYNRENSRNHISEYIQTQQDIQEEDESETASELTNIEKEKLESCLEQIKATIGATNVSRNELVNIIISHNFDVEKAVDAILNSKCLPTHQKEKVFAQPTTILSSDSEVPSIKVVTSGGKTTTNITKGFDLSQKDNNSARLSSGSSSRSQSPGSGRATPTIGVKVVTSGGKTTTNIAKGFDFSQKDYNSARLSSASSSRSQSPASGRATPTKSEGSKAVRNKVSKIDVEAQYKKERGQAKEHLYMVVIGHVDAGKSTLMGRLLCDLGQVNKKTMHKYEQESKKLGKQSFMYAWVLDETGEERNRGITMDIGRSQFETKTKHVTLLDAPGHKDFIPNMISGAGQADVALLVVDATRGEFETGFDFGGQTREHALLVRSLGVTQLAVAINKLDTVSWSKSRFDEIAKKLKTFLKQAGFRENDVTFVPCSGLTGQNLIQKPTENELLSWYDGPCLLEVIDNFRTPTRPVSKPFRLSVNDVFKGTGSGFCVSGRVETGSLNVGNRVMLCPNREIVIVKSLFIDDLSRSVVFAGDEATITLSGVEMQNVSIGNVLCDPQNPVQICTKFQARIVVFNSTIPITKGFSVVLHHQSLVEPAVVSKLVSQLNKSTGELVKKHPRFLSNNTSAIVEIQVSRPIAVELYSDCKELGRIMLRVGGVTIAAGLITKIIS